MRTHFRIISKLPWIGNQAATTIDRWEENQKTKQGIKFLMRADGGQELNMNEVSVMGSHA
jgi:hypothetical protein